MENNEIFNYDPRLENVRRYVDEHLADPLPLGRVAKVAGLERKYFSSFFHQQVGMCFRDWLAAKRIDRAVQMIRSANYTITHVALSAGFSSLRAFERAFKKTMGMSPRAFKKQVRPRPVTSDVRPFQPAAERQAGS